MSGAGAQWSTGAYAYDGAGNIKQIGGNAYQYDAFCFRNDAGQFISQWNDQTLRETRAKVKSGKWRRKPKHEEDQEAQ